MALRQSFQPDGPLEIQSSEDVYEVMDLCVSDEDRFLVCYVQLWLFAMRHWWEMTGTRPRKDHRDRLPLNTDEMEDSQRCLRQLARRLGFHVAGEDEPDVAPWQRDYEPAGVLTNDCKLLQQQSERGGVPSVDDLGADQASCFWPRILHNHLKEKTYCTSLFGRRTFCVLFFGLRVQQMQVRKRTRSEVFDCLASYPSMARESLSVMPEIAALQVGSAEMEQSSTALVLNDYSSLGLC